MRNKKRLSTAIIVGCLSAMCLSTTALGATKSFTAHLPKNRADIEVSTISKAKTTEYFTLTIKSIAEGTDKVCAWTEGDSLGINYSSPYVQVGIESRNIDYNLKQPKKGEAVVLNLDNPVSLSYTVKVTGSWTPN